MRIAECSDASSVLQVAEAAVMGSQNAETLKGKKREKKHKKREKNGAASINQAPAQLIGLTQLVTQVRLVQLKTR